MRKDVDSMLKQLVPNSQEKILDQIHTMRLRAFNERTNENKTKPHMPLVNDDVKQVMVQEYFDAKRQLKNI